MNRDNRNNYKITLLVGILCIIVILTSTSYAYFKTRIKGDGSTISITGGKLNLVINENKINLTNVAPIYENQKDTKASKNEFSINLSNTGVSKACYNIYLDVDNIGTNLQNRFLKYELSDGTNIYTGNFDGVASGTKIIMVRNESLTSSSPSKNYTLKLWLQYSESDDQGYILEGDEASRTFEGKLHITGTTGECKSKTLAEAMLEDNKVLPDRTDFSVTNTSNTTGTIYQTNKTEDGSTVYYYSGNTSNNWVKFGGFYWRIIRTNEDKSIRLLYSGTSHDTASGYIILSKFSGTTTSSMYNNPMYAGYMYGTSGSLESNRTNTNNSTIKAEIDNWYDYNLYDDYNKYVSKTAIYCNDRSVKDNSYSMENTFIYASRERLESNKTPTYKCGGDGNGGLFEDSQAIEDKFSASTEGGGNGQLEDPIALMTADEVSFAGGVFGIEQSNKYSYYYTNSIGESITGNNQWWLLSPERFYYGDVDVFGVDGSDYPARLRRTFVDRKVAIRPVLSLSSCVKMTGRGTADDPYQVDESASTC